MDVPRAFTLEQNYPNPFNPSTRIAFSLPAARLPEGQGQAGVQGSGFTSLRVYDVLGREVATLVNENLSAGSYEVMFNAKGLASGVYFYKLQVGEFSETKRLLLLR
ncbi:MAG: T9SS type A sorting domain-containing protein [Ignavibacteriae bacterium]|nr:T9SS type A sorting domain-containing protein [Ignavibacteriota bacterium]